MDISGISSRGLVLLGCGKMGSALLEGWLAKGVPPAAFTVIEPKPGARLVALEAEVEEGQLGVGVAALGAPLGVVTTRGLPRGLEEDPGGRVRGEAGEEVEAAIAADEVAPPPAEPRGFPCPGDETLGGEEGVQVAIGDANSGAEGLGGHVRGRVPRLRTGRGTADGTGGRR